MGLKFAWSVMDYKCCHSCIHCNHNIKTKKIIKSKKFYCCVGVKINNDNNDMLNLTHCINHRFNKSFKRKIKTTKYKSKMVKIKQKIYRTLAKEYPHGN